ncbi:MAG: metallophosphoesterase, partial [Acidobacteria bacterium]|nr:metallophosphoesterase [Acidobacteriota bacterium]
MTNYDIIGDVHGRGAKLTGLLEVLGWRPDGDGVHRHAEPDRQVIFVGDLVDRGEDQRQVLTIARAMVEAGTARMVMGNHEFNAICYATEHPDRPGDYLRAHSPKNTKQCSAFLQQLSAEEQADWVAWFRTLPLWLDEEELGGLRVVHACWHEESMRVVREACGGNVLGDDVALYARASDPDDPLFTAIEVLLKGPEVRLADYDLPPFEDPEGHARDHARLRWWRSGDLSLKEMIDIRCGTRTASGGEYPDLARM